MSFSQLLLSREPRTPNRATTLVVVLVIAALTGLQLWGVLVDEGSPGRTALGGVVAALACTLVPLTLHRPVLGALLLAVLAGASPTASPAATLGTLYVARCRPLALALVVGGVGVGAHVLRWLWWPTAGLTLGWWTLLVVAVHAALVLWGALSQSRAAEIAWLRERALRAEADQLHRVQEARLAERTQIAREMHDVLAHRLSLLATHAGALEFRPDAPPEQVAHAAGVVRAGTHQALQDLRDVIGVLRFQAPEAERARPQPTLRQLTALAEETEEAGTRVTVHLAPDLDPAAVPEAASRTAYRVVQEALTNVRKHARGANAEVRVAGEPGSSLEVTITNGPGRAPVQLASDARSAGLIGLAERVALAGGTLTHRPHDGGFRVHASLPWPA